MFRAMSMPARSRIRELPSLQLHSQVTLTGPGTPAGPVPNFIPENRTGEGGGRAGDAGNPVSNFITEIHAAACSRITGRPGPEGAARGHRQWGAGTSAPRRPMSWDDRAVDVAIHARVDLLRGTPGFVEIRIR